MDRLLGDGAGPGFSPFRVIRSIHELHSRQKSLPCAINFSSSSLRTKNSGCGCRSRSSPLGLALPCVLADGRGCDSMGAWQKIGHSPGSRRSCLLDRAATRADGSDRIGYSQTTLCKRRFCFLRRCKSPPELPSSRFNALWFSARILAGYLAGLWFHNTRFSGTRHTVSPRRSRGADLGVCPFH